jgi:selenocysteine-specific elongation factor
MVNHMRVIGTAGHVDHGKSTLIAALTGTHPDRLKEEREREMTIDLGFGWLTLPSGEEIGIVDVPGHRDFIENMLSGIGGIDAALLIIAADEGVMPQTREHLAIIDLLQIERGIVVLTKTDLAHDGEWLELIESDIKAVLKRTTLRDAPLVRVSAKTGQGLDILLSKLDQILRDTTIRPDLGRPRLPIDRVFSIAGYGTVVTGTLSDGKISVGDEVEILPSRKKGRIRGLQTHKKKEETSLPGSRTAVNISGLSVEEISRGETLVTPGNYSSTRRVDVYFRLLPDVDSPLKHGVEVKFFTGTSETIAILRLVGTESLEPGETGWGQLELRDPVVVVRGDRFILRRPSPSETLGGGLILDSHPKTRHKRFDETVIKHFEAMLKGSPDDVLLQTSLAMGPSSIKDIITQSRLDDITASQALIKLTSEGRLISLEEVELTRGSDTLVMAGSAWIGQTNTIIALLKEYQSQFPLRRGMPREELKSRLQVSPKVFNLFIKKLAAQDQVTEGGTWVSLPDHEIKFDEKQKASIKKMMDLCVANPYSPPIVKEMQAIVGEEVYTALLTQGELIQVSPEIAFRKNDFEMLEKEIRNYLEKNGKISVAEARDLFNTSRKYILPVLEYLDASGLTKRDGDFRKLKK